MIDKFESSYEVDYTLILKGGGIKGIAYVGALEELEKHYEFNWNTGTSVGGILAILLSAGFKVSELKSILLEKNFNDFKDSNVIGGIINLLTLYGLYKAKTFNRWINSLLSTKLNSTTEVVLGDLKKRVSVFASSSNEKVVIFDSEKVETANVSAAYAARCSMSIPFIFVPQHKNGHRVFDGGVQNNFPINLILDENPEIKFIGLYIGEKFYKGGNKTLVGELMSIWMSSNEMEYLKNNKDDIIIIDTKPISTLNFNLNDYEKDYLLKQGKISALRFLEKKGKIKNGLHEIKKLEKELNEKKIKLETEKKYKKNKFKFFLSLILIAALSILIIFCSNNSEDYKSLNDTFTVTVIVHGKEGRDDIVLKGEGDVIMDYGITRELESINEEGEATFKEIPKKFINKNVTIGIKHSQPYLPVNRFHQYTLKENQLIYLEIELKGIDKVSGKVIDYESETPLENVRVSINNSFAYTDKFGWFEIKIPVQYRSKFVSLHFYKEGYEIKKFDSIAPHTKQEVELSLMKKE